MKKIVICASLAARAIFVSPFSPFLTFTVCALNKFQQLHQHRFETNFKHIFLFLGLIISILTMRNISKGEELFVDYEYSPDIAESKENHAWYFAQVAHNHLV